MGSRSKLRFSRKTLFCLVLLIVPNLPDGLCSQFQKPNRPKQFAGAAPPKVSRPMQQYNNQFAMQPTSVKFAHNPPPLIQGKIMVRQVPVVGVLPPRPFVLQKQKKCEGRKNIVDDIGVLSLMTAVLSSTFGIYSVIGNSVMSNNIGIVSGIMGLAMWLPSSIITIFDKGGSYFYRLSNALNGIAFVNSLFGLTSIYFGTMDVLTSGLGELVAVSSLALSVVATFPEFLDALIELVYSIGNKQYVSYYIENYGCEVPGVFTIAGRRLYDFINRVLTDVTMALAHPKKRKVLQ